MFTIPVWGASALIGGGTLLGPMAKSQEGSRQTSFYRDLEFPGGVRGTGWGNFGGEVGTVFRGMDNS